MILCGNLTKKRDVGEAKHTCHRRGTNYSMALFPLVFGVWSLTYWFSRSSSQRFSTTEQCINAEPSLVEHPFETALKNSVAERPNHSNLWVIRIQSKFCQNSWKFPRILQKLWNVEEFSIFSRVFSKFPRKFHQNQWKIRSETWFENRLNRDGQKLPKHHACNGFRAWQDPAEIRSCHPKKLSKPLRYD